MPKYSLSLYITGQTARSLRAAANLRRICDQYLGADGASYELNLIDVQEHPELAEAARILATPATIRVAPPPAYRVIGDLSDPAKVLAALGIIDFGDAPVLQTGAVQSGPVQSGPVVKGGPALNTPQNAAPGGPVLLETGIPGLDVLAMGGLPRNRTTLVSGTAGSDKTLLAVQFLVEGIRKAGEPCVFVTLEESPDDIRSNMLSLGWDIACWEADGTWAFVDGSALFEQEETLIGDFDLGGLLARIQGAVARVGAKRLAIDAIGALFMRFGDTSKIRLELLHISRALRRMNVTSIMSCERSADYGEVGRYGVEEFVADNVIILRNVLEAELRRRTLEILKMRGVPHRRGEFPFVVTNGRGIEVIPLSAIALAHKSTGVRVPFGNAGLDRIFHGGPFRESTTLVSGPTGSGKTLTATEFACGATGGGERCLFLGFEESRDQVLSNAGGWGHDFAQMEADGLLRLICEYPEAASLEDRLVRIKEIVGEFRPHRIVLDSVSSLRRIASAKSLRDFILGLTAFVKQEQIPTLYTATIEQIVGAPNISEIEVSMFTDAIILLRYVEIAGRIHHGVTALKMRGSRHETDIYEFTIDDQGMHIGEPFRGVHGALTGNPLLTGLESVRQDAVREDKND